MITTTFAPLVGNPFGITPSTTQKMFAPYERETPLSDQIQAFLRAHPGTGSGVIFKHFGEPGRKALLRMIRNGKLTRTGDYRAYHYKNAEAVK